MDDVIAGDQFSISLIYLESLSGDVLDGWGSVLNIPDILDQHPRNESDGLGISSQYP